MPEIHDINQTPKNHMSDVDRVMDCLCGAKDRSLMYAHAALESTNNGLREFFLAMHGEETHNQEILFSFLHTRGSYPTKMAADECIQEMRKRYQDLHDAMGLTDKPSSRRYSTADPKFPPSHIQAPGSFEYKPPH